MANGKAKFVVVCERPLSGGPLYSQKWSLQRKANFMAGINLQHLVLPFASSILEWGLSRVDFGT